MGELTTYEELASEYYDARRHPTCANFRTASRAILEHWLPIANSPHGEVWEVGAGASLVAELLSQRDKNLDRLLILDSSPSMLRHSEQWQRHGAELVVAPATDIPAADASAELVVSSLGDAYNVDAFWAEVGRVLAPDGLCLFTTPAHAWSSRFRNGADAGTAEFELADGRHVLVPSFIDRPEQQAERIERAGLVVEEVVDLPFSRLDAAEPRSPKLEVVRDDDASVITGYRARRPASGARRGPRHARLGSE